MDIQTKMLLICLVALGMMLILSVLKVTAAWYDHHVSRHNLIIQSKQRRYDYLKAKYELERAAQAIEEGESYDTIIIEDEEPALAQAA